MNFNRNKHCSFVQWLDRTAEKCPLLWFPCVLLIVLALVGEHIFEYAKIVYRYRHTEKVIKEKPQFERKPFAMRAAALTLAVAFPVMTVQQLGLIGIDVFADEIVNEEIDGIVDDNSDITVGTDILQNEQAGENGDFLNDGTGEASSENEGDNTVSEGIADGTENALMDEAANDDVGVTVPDSDEFELTVVVGGSEPTLAISGYKGNKTDVVIPEKIGEMRVTEIGETAFYCCTSITSITIPDSVTTIRNSAFRSCTSLTSIIIPDSVTAIEKYAFENCTSLTSITIPDSVTLLGDAAFYRCTSLTNVTVPNSLTSIGMFAFYGCTSLTSIIIPNSVTLIGNNAFRGCKSLTSITIPDSVASIRDETFEDCTSLTSITIPDSVTSIGNYAFRNCTSLTSITIPDSVTSIGSSAFERCISLTSITIPDSVTSLGYGGAFSYCTSLTSITVAPNNIRYSSLDGVLFNNDLSILIQYPAGLIEKISYTIPNSVTSIGADAFGGCTSLTSITIPDSVASIEWDAFSGCTSLTSITIPDSVTSIRNETFEDCTSLTSITIPDSVTSIGGDAFKNCKSLTSITIPDSVTSIGSEAFYYCTSLTSITIPDSVTSIGEYAFYECKSLTIYGYNGSYAETYANKHNIPFKDISEYPGGNPFPDIPGIGENKTITSPNGTLQYTGYMVDGFVKEKQYSVGSIIINFANGAEYKNTDFLWTWNKEVIEVKDFDYTDDYVRVYYIMWGKGQAAINADVGGGEIISIPFSVNESNLKVDIEAATANATRLSVSNHGNVENSPFQVGFTIYPYINDLLITPPMGDSEQIQVNEKKNQLMQEMKQKVQSGFGPMKNCKITLPNGFTFDDGTNIEEATLIIPIKLNKKTTYYCDKKVSLINVDPIDDTSKMSKSYSFGVSMELGGETYECKGDIRVSNADYVAPSKPTEIPEEDSSTPKNSAAIAFERKYRSHLNSNDNVSRNICSSFSELGKMVNSDWFDKIVADTEMFCDLEMLGTTSSDGFDFGVFFGYDELKANAWYANKKTLLTFNNVKNKKNNKTYTVYIQLETNAAGIGGGKASYCTATPYIDVGNNEAVQCGIPVAVTYSDLKSLSSDLKEIYNKAAHVGDYEYWIKTGICDYLGVQEDLGINVKDAQTIVTLIDKLYKSVSKWNLDPFKINSVSDINKLFKNVYGVAEGKQKLISILCPVDVEVLDSEGNIVGAIYDNSVSTSTVAAQMAVNGDKKSVILPLTDNYTIRLIGTDTGTMSYIVDEIVNGKTVRTVTFEQLPLTSDKTYTGSVEDIIFQLTEDYALKDEDNIIYPADNDTHNFDIQSDNYVITIPKSVQVLRGTEHIADNEIVQSGDILTVSANETDDNKIKSLTINGIKIENGSSYTVSNGNIVIEVEYTNDNVHIHNLSSTYSSDKTGHWYDCSKCDEKVDFAAHTEDKGTVTLEATETTDGIMTYKCSVCGYVMRTKTIPAGHKHKFGTDWKTDRANHWHECTCGEKSNLGAHTEDRGTVTVQPTATTSGTKTYSCSECGYVMRTETLPATGYNPYPSAPTYPVVSPVPITSENEIEVTLESDLSGISAGKVHFSTKKRFFKNSAVVTVSNTETANNAASMAISYLSGGAEHNIIYPFDISIYNADTYEKMQLKERGYITFEIPVPDILSSKTDEIGVYHIVDGKSEAIKSRIVEKGGVSKIRFTAESFSPYMFAAYSENGMEDVSSGAGVTANSIPIDFAEPTTNGVGMPSARLPQIMKFSNKKRKYRILRKRRLDDLVFVL